MTSIANTNGLVHFITGATSLLGSEYLFNVLASDDDTRCSVLIHAKGQRSAEKRLTALLDYLYGRGDMHLHMRQRIDVYGGDIRKKDFGLSQEQLKVLESSVNYIFHAASNSNLTDSKSSLNQSNITGTVSVINFAKNCQNLMRLMHVSSAYVSGSKTGKRIIEKNLNQQGVQYRKAKLVSEPAFKYLIGPTLSLFHKHGRKMNRDFVMLSRYSCINRIFDNSDTFKTLGEDRHTLPDLDGYYKNIIRYAIEACSFEVNWHWKNYGS